MGRKVYVDVKYLRFGIGRRFGDGHRPVTQRRNNTNQQYIQTHRYEQGEAIE